MSSIGVQREGPLHASLKHWYAQPGDRVEADVDGYVIDLIRDDLLIEIQTGGFAGMRHKAVGLLGLGHRIRVVHPIAVDRWIIRLDGEGAVLDRRRSPRHGTAADVVTQLVSVPDLLAEPGFELELLLIREEELRRHEPGRCWRRRGWIVRQRRLVEVVDRIMLASPADLLALLPSALLDPFTTTDLAVSLGVPCG